MNKLPLLFRDQIWSTKFRGGRLCDLEFQERDNKGQEIRGKNVTMKHFGETKK